MLGTSLRPERATVDQVKERFKKVKDKILAPKVVDDYEEKMRRLKDQKERRKLEEKEKKKEIIKKKKEEKKKAEEAEQDPILIQLGLPSGFGTSKK
jgi:U4/U6.U5 tri-snRNP component SNU23